MTAEEPIKVGAKTFPVIICLGFGAISEWGEKNKAATTCLETLIQSIETLSRTIDLKVILEPLEEQRTVNAKSVTSETFISFCLSPTDHKQQTSQICRA